MLIPPSPVGSDRPQGAGPKGGTLWSVSVIICTYREDRWPLLVQSLSSVQHQTRAPAEILLCVDHNETLLKRCQNVWANGASGPSIPITVIPNRYLGRLGSARNSAAELARGDILAFLDDDAWADPDWLEWLLMPYEREDTVAVGGAPIAEYETSRPRWLPFEFDWVFGCAYAGLPERQAPLAHLIGANMSVRSPALKEIGGFQSDHHDDMDMCHRLAHRRPAERILYEPKARVHHFVPAERTTWSYFCRRCFVVNKGKVRAFHQMEAAANLSAELNFVRRAVSRGASLGFRQAFGGDLWGAARALSILVGIGLAGAGHLVGQAQWLLTRQRVRLSLGSTRSHHTSPTVAP